MREVAAKDLSSHAIVADIGGTNARFSRIDLSSMKLDKTATYACSAFSSLQEAIQAYQKEYKLETIRQLGLALACPVIADEVYLTNLPWRFSIQQLQQELELKSLAVLNDFAAIALSLPFLSEKEIVYVGDAEKKKHHPKVVLGAGTGLGVACIMPAQHELNVVVSEAGHSDWSAQNEQEWFIQQYLAQEYGHVSIERVLSGPGLENIDSALALYQGEKSRNRSAADITSLALKKKCSLAMRSVEQFCASLGSFAGDLALTFNAFGGVYLAGGIVPHILPCLQSSAFRKRFEAKGRFAKLNKDTATLAVTAAQPGLIGAAVCLQKQSGYKTRASVQYTNTNALVNKQ